MALTFTTLSAAMAAGDLTMTVASATGFSASTTAPTIAQIDDELVGIKAINSTVISITRGLAGTRAVAHGSGRAVSVATPAEFQALGIFYNSAPMISRFASGPFYPTTNPVTISTAGAVTLTAGQVLAGIILRDTNGASRTDTLPTAALLAAAAPGVQIGSTFELLYRNTAGAAETITIAAGTGGTVTGGGTMTIAQNNSKLFWIRFTGVVPGSEAYIVYSLGTSVF